MYDRKSLLHSVLIHLALLLLFVVAVWILPKPKKIETYNFSIEEKVITAPREKPPLPEALDISQQTPVKDIPKDPPKKAFGLNKNTLTTDAGEAVAVKTGNTIAKELDNIESDGEALPVPVQEFLVNKMPRVKKEVRLPYPAEAKKQGVDGVVLLDILIDEKGQVRQVTLVKGVGYGLDESAIEAIRGFEFEPAYMDQKPVAVKIRYAYRFVLD